MRWSRVGLAAGVSALGLAAARAARASQARERPPEQEWNLNAAAVAALLTGASLPVLAREAARSRDPALFWILLAAQQLRFCGAVIHHHVVYRVFEGRGDAEEYYRAASRLVRRFRKGRFGIRLGTRPGLAGMNYLMAIVQLLLRPTRRGAFLVFSWLGFWGLFFFHRAFVIAVPDGDSRLYLALLGFAPSMLIFPSSISKQAWMLFTLGLAALGAAHVLSRGDARGLSLVVLGTALAALVRPHIAAMFALAFALASTPLWFEDKRVMLVAALAVAILLPWAARHLRKWGIGVGNLPSLLRQAGARSGYGDSAFSPVIPHTLRDVPLALATVLFRPHLLEAQNARVRALALESSLFCALSLARLGSLRARPRNRYVLMTLVFTGLFALGHSWVANFGLLGQHRTQLFPFSLVPIALRPA